jgi:hypothetical protein
LEGAPKIIKGVFDCEHNNLQSLDYLSEGTTPEILFSDFSEEYVLKFFRSNRPETLI